MTGTQNQKKKWRRNAVIVALLLAGSYGLKSVLSEENDSQKQSVAKVIRGQLEETITATGKLEPKEFVDVGTQVSGQLEKLYVEIGDTVKKDDPIAQIDPKLYEAAVRADEARLKTLNAQLDEQKATVSYARSVYERNSKLIKADAVSREVWQDSERELKAAEARIASYKAQIEEAESQRDANITNLGYTKIFAPMDGTVVSQTSKEGQTLNANQTAPVIVQVANLDTMTARAQVAEADISRLKQGMHVYFTTLRSDRRWASTLRQLLPSPDATVTDVVLYNVLVDVENQDRALMTGMSVQMFFVLGSAEDALLIPTQALGKKLGPAPDGTGEQYEVQLRTGSKTETRNVTVGLMNRNQAQILSGLSEGDDIILPVTGAGAASAPTSGNRPRMPRM